MRRRRVAAVLALPWLCLALAPPATVGAASTPAFDAYIATGNASCLELTVSTSYNFIVEPDVRLPRATSTISEGTSGALAAPVDPGDSVDALAGLMVPREEGTLAAGLDQATGQIPVPLPVGTDQGLSQVESVVNPSLEYPYEHANAAYPNPAQPGDQQATYLGAPSATATDPTGVLTLNGGFGNSAATAASASAEGGAGASLSVLPLGISAGRIDAKSVAGVSGNTVSDDVSCNLQNVTIAPPGTSLSVHVGSLIATLHTERAVGAATATSSRTLQLADVTINGNNVIPQASGGIALPPTTFTAPALPGGLPVSVNAITVTGSQGTETRSAAGNEDTTTLTGATVSIATTMPVPASIPPTGSGNPLSTSPVIYTLQLANLDSSTYGLATIPLPLLGGTTAPAFTGSGPAGPGHVVTYPGTPGSPGSATTGSRVASATVSIPGVPGAIRWAVLVIAVLLELALLSSLAARYRWLRRRVPASPPHSFLDLP